MYNYIVDWPNKSKISKITPNNLTTQTWLANCHQKN